MNVTQSGSRPLHAPVDDTQGMHRRVLQDLERQWLDTWRVISQEPADISERPPEDRQRDCDAASQFASAQLQSTLVPAAQQQGPQQQQESAVEREPDATQPQALAPSAGGRQAALGMRLQPPAVAGIDAATRLAQDGDQLTAIGHESAPPVASVAPQQSAPHARPRMIAAAPIAEEVSAPGATMQSPDRPVLSASKLQASAGNASFVEPGKRGAAAIRQDMTPHSVPASPAESRSTAIAQEGRMQLVAGRLPGRQTNAEVPEAAPPAPIQAARSHFVGKSASVASASAHGIETLTSETPSKTVVEQSALEIAPRLQSGSAMAAKQPQPEGDAESLAPSQKARLQSKPLDEHGPQRLTLRELSEHEVLASMRDASLTSAQSQLAAQGLARALMEAGYARVQVVVNGKPATTAEAPSSPAPDEPQAPATPHHPPQETRHGH